MTPQKTHDQTIKKTSMLPIHSHGSSFYDPGFDLWPDLPPQADLLCETCYRLWQAFTQHCDTAHAHTQFSSQRQIPITPTPFRHMPPFGPLEGVSTLPSTLPVQSTFNPSTNASCPVTPFYPPPSEQMNFPRRTRSIFRPQATIPTLPFAIKNSNNPRSTHHPGLPSSSLPSSTDPSPFPSPASAASFSSQQETPGLPSNELPAGARGRAESVRSLRKKPRPKAADYADMRKIKACEECRRLKRKCSPNHPGVRLNWAESEYNMRSDG